MKKCKKYDLQSIKENKLNVSGTLQKIPRRLDYLDLSESTIFRPPLPKKPTVTFLKTYPRPSTNKHNGTEYTLKQQMFISFNGKTFKVGSKAVIDSTGEQSTITNIGQKLILLKKDLQSKEKRLHIEEFIELNK